MTDYSRLSKEDLLKKLEELEAKATKRFGLVWDEERTKEKFEVDSENALPVLKEVKSRKIETNPSKPVNIMIEGDNYHALEVLQYTHQGKIDVIYADPPYNTGARDWKYNNKYVDDSDTYRHSKWLSLMKKRLELAKSLLKEEGIICVTIDDNELPRLLILMEDIFGESNHLGTAAIRINPGGRKTKRSLALQHEYAIFFSKSFDTKVAKVNISPDQKTHSYKKDENGNWYEERNLRKEGQDSLATEKTKRFFPIYWDPKSGKVSTTKKYSVQILPIDTQGQKRIWRRDASDVDRMFQKKEIFIKETKNGPQVYFYFFGGVEGETPKSFWDNPKFSASEHGTQVLDSILGETGKFQFPKSVHAVEDAIKVCSSRNDSVVLDFFAGSGTTGHAVLALNKEDKGTRQFILCTNNENNIATDICYPRVKRVIEGYKNNGNGQKVAGLGGNLRYYKTDFVKESINRDDLKVRITKECTEMLCLREGVFEDFKKAEQYRIFKQGDRYLAIYYDMDRSAMPNLRKELEKLKGEKVAYIFTFDEAGLDLSDMATWTDVRFESIPQKILDAYYQAHER